MNHDKMTNISAKRGFLWPSFEIYSGVSGFTDYGPLGASLKNNIMPFIILDEYKSYYLRGLKEYGNDKAFLTDTCKHAQDIYENICNELLDFEINDK